MDLREFYAIQHRPFSTIHAPNVLNALVWIFQERLVCDTGMTEIPIHDLPLRINLSTRGKKL